MHILYLISANPLDKALRIDVEQRAIKQRLPRTWRTEFAPAARLGDIISDLREFAPDVVHISAHGSPTERILLLGDDNEATEVSRKTIEVLFKVMQKKIRLVVLNACYSKTQADLIKKTIDCVIGVSRTLKDTDAIRYSEQLYAGLAAGRSVGKAHEEASIVLTDVPSEHKPDLLARSGVDVNDVFIARRSRRRTAQREQTVPASPPHSNYLTEKKSAFERAEARFGVSAECLTVLKIGNPDGSFISRYEIKGLRVTGTEIASITWRFESGSALVMAPDLDDSVTDAGIGWVTDPESPPSSFEDVLKSLGTIRGRFVLKPRLKPKLPRSFAWTMQVLNGDALTVWEFRKLYPKNQRVDLSGVPLTGKPSEYFAHLVWFPVRELRIGVRLPPSQILRPKMRYFELKASDSRDLPVMQVVRDEELWMGADRDSDWAQQNAKWERNSEVEDLEKGSLGPNPETELRIEYPVLGSYYSLEWNLPDPALPADIDRLRAETEVVRDGLLKHKQARLSAPATPDSERIRKLFAAVHGEARNFLGATESSFATTLMTWDREQRRMVVVETMRNDQNENESDWKFWVPFGLGLAGMCFRSATGAFRYQRDLDKTDPERPENYLPLPGSEPHAFLLCMPIDHPRMTEEMARQENAQRCRQLVGVLSIGSRSPASRLLEYCRATLTDDMFGKLRDLRDALQRKMDEIAEMLLDEAGFGSHVSVPVEKEPSGTTEDKPVVEGAGIVHQPGPGWVSPIQKNRFRYKVAAFDFDGTLLRGDKFAFSWELVWRNLQFGKSVQNDLKRKYRLRAEKANRTERIDAYRAWCERAVEMFKSRGLTRDQLKSMSQALTLTHSCREALKQLREAGVVTALISGGISQILEDTFPDYCDYFDFVFMNELLFVDSGVISGVRATAYDFEGKADALMLVCERAGATRDETVFIGDRFNDEAVMLQVSSAIAYPPSDDVAESVTHVAIHEDDLLKVVPHILIE
jgi:HAD superfamily phosphoserine phosphatase-like hydrolase